MASSLEKYSIPGALGTMATRRFHVMAKPAGSACNLDCTYCYYLSKRELPGGPGPGHMSDDLLELFVRNYIPAGMPRNIVTRLSDEVQKAAKSATVIERYAARGSDPLGTTPEQFTDFIRKEYLKWAEVIKRAGLKQQ